MKSETLFNRIIGSGVLLSSGAIIPSYSALRQQLLRQLNQLLRLLQEEQCPRQESYTLCHLLGTYLDIYLHRDRQQQGGLATETPLISGLQESGTLSVPTTVAAQLELLADCADHRLFDYGYTLINLLSLPDLPQDADIRLLLARYQQRKCSPSPLSAADRQIHLPAVAENNRVSLIAGPCTSNWFNQYDTTRDQQGVVWLIAADPQQFVRHCQVLAKQHPAEPLCCVIPLLGDIYQTNALLAAEFQRWAEILASVSGLPALSCQLVIYSPLSQQRQRHDPDAAFWVSRHEDLHRNHHLNGLIQRLSQHLKVSESDAYAVQRRLAATILLEWLSAPPINAAVQSLFTGTPLSLSGVMLADYGHGFTRHGAWSAWLSEHYLLCPSLADSPTPPPLPQLPHRVVATVRHIPQTLPPAATDYRRRHRLAVWLPLLVIAGIYGSIALLPSPRPLSESTPRLSPSSPGHSLTRDDFAPWFAPGSSMVLAERYQTLAALVPELQKHARYPVLIVGYSDNTGNSDSNRQLSLQRALGIRDWLVTNTGLPESQFIVDGAGESRPLVTDNSTAGQASNRRIEIISLFPQTFKVNKDYD